MCRVWTEPRTGTQMEQALKQQNREKEKEGFSIMVLREVDAILRAQHPTRAPWETVLCLGSIDKICMGRTSAEHDLCRARPPCRIVGGS